MTDLERLKEIRLMLRRLGGKMPCKFIADGTDRCLEGPYHGHDTDCPYGVRMKIEEMVEAAIIDSRKNED